MKSKHYALGWIGSKDGSVQWPGVRLALALIINRLGTRLNHLAERIAGLVR